MSSPFTLTIDWLAFTLPSGSVKDTMEMLGGDWTKGDTGFRGYPVSWITTSAPVEWANSGPVHIGLRSKCMWISLPASWPLGRLTRFVRSSDGF